MDLYKAIRQLCSERERLDRAIASLEELAKSGVREAPPLEPAPLPEPPAGRRGRKTMDPAERRQVAERMKRYWAGKRKGGEDTPPAR